jgi:MFS family permease
VGELAPAHSRGRMVSFTVFGIDSGYFMSTTLSLAFSFVDHPYQWRLNFITGIIYDLCLLVSLIWIPESPRWLAMQERHDQDYKILEWLHRNKHDPNANLARAEMYQIRVQTEADKLLPKGYLHILRTPGLRKRGFCTVAVWALSQGTGNLAIANLTPVLFGDLDFILLLNSVFMAWLVVAESMALVGGLFVDKRGRVPFLGIFHEFHCFPLLCYSCFIAGTVNINSWYSLCHNPSC